MTYEVTPVHASNQKRPYLRISDRIPPKFLVIITEIDGGKFPTNTLPCFSSQSMTGLLIILFKVPPPPPTHYAVLRSNRAWEGPQINQSNCKFVFCSRKRMACNLVFSNFYKFKALAIATVERITSYSLTLGVSMSNAEHFNSVMKLLSHGQRNFKAVIMHEAHLKSTYVIINSYYNCQLLRTIDINTLEFLTHSPPQRLL